jgi:hypothetical protein
MHFQAKNILQSNLYHTFKHLYIVSFKSVFRYKIHQNNFFHIFYLFLISTHQNYRKELKNTST